MATITWLDAERKNIQAISIIIIVGKVKFDGYRKIRIMSEAYCDVERTLIHETGIVSQAALVLMFLLLFIHISL